jgi:hypothetical protein
MKVNRPASPLSGGAEPLEPLEPQDLQDVVKGERFAAALSQLEAQAAGGAEQPGMNPVRAALEQIAQQANLSSNEGAAEAVRESARYMIRTRLHEKFRRTEHGDRLVEKLSEYVATDPLLNTKLLSILRRVKAG